MQEKVKILGVRFDNVTLEEALMKALKFARGTGPQKHYICTPNPEMLLEAQKNEEFLHILNKSSLNIPDGVGILLAASYKKSPLKERVTGTDLMKKICIVSDKKIFLLGAGEGVAEKAKKVLGQANIVGTHAGSPQEDEKTRRLINKSGAEILFVAYGAPAQELWIARNLKHLSSVKLAIGVGGAFDFLAGKVKRAPLFMRKCGLEWLYRLIREPRRAKRIYNAVVKFPVEVLKNTIDKL